MARGGYRPNSGPKKGAKYKKRGDKAVKPKRKKGIPADIKADAKAADLDPLTYMLKVMNDTEADIARRDRMASVAAPYCHPRKGEGAGKKQDKDDRARAAGKGKFGAGAPPRLVAKGGKVVK